MWVVKIVFPFGFGSQEPAQVDERRGKRDEKESVVGASGYTWGNNFSGLQV